MNVSFRIVFLENLERGKSSWHTEQVNFSFSLLMAAVFSSLSTDSGMIVRKERILAKYCMLLEIKMNEITTPTVEVRCVVGDCGLF